MEADEENKMAKSKVAIQHNDNNNDNNHYYGQRNWLIIFNFCV